MSKSLETEQQWQQAKESGRLLIVDCYATWCGPCKVISPVFEALAAEHSRDATFFKLDVDQNQSVAKELGVRAMPTFIFFKGSKELLRFEGADKQKLTNHVKEQCRQHSANVFAQSQGFRLSDQGSSAPQPAAAAANPNAAPNGRRNPWADPNNPLVQRALSSQTTQPQAAAPAQPATAAAPAGPRNNTPWSDPNFQPRQPSAQPQAAQPAAAAAAVGGEVDPVLLEQLTMFGVPEARARAALAGVKNTSIDAALDWLNAHPEGEEVPGAAAPAPAAGPSGVPAASRLLASASKPLGEDETADDAAILAEAARKARNAPEEPVIIIPQGKLSSDYVDPVTNTRVGDMKPIEKAEYMARLRAEAKAKRERDELERSKESEKNRRELARAASELKEKVENDRRQAEAARKRREQLESERRMNELREQMRRDREQRRIDQERELQRVREAKAAGQQPQPPK